MKKWLALLAVSAAPLSATAADAEGHWYVVPKVGYTFTDDRRNTDDDLFYGAAIGKDITQVWSLELNAATGTHDRSDTNGELDLTPISLDSLFHFNRKGMFDPFVSIGLGTIVNDHHPGQNRDDFMLQAGVGALVNFWENGNGTSKLGLRPEAKVRWDDRGNRGAIQGWAHDYLLSVGLQFSFGGKVTAAPVAAPAPAPAPPPPEPVAATPPPPPPPPAPVDSDGDGVLDPADACPGTPRGVAVDNTGCPRKGSITLTGVTFETNSAKLTAESNSVLDAVAADLKKYSRLKVEVQGHTDSMGADAYNLRLSQQRSESVRAYLVAQGVSEAQLVAKGYGETTPVADNATAAGRAENRRVVLAVLDNPGDVEVKTE
jgi:OOP family OmpA-OmpF porin